MTNDTHGKNLEQFKWEKGQSGNPLGRPKAQKRDTVDVVAVLDSPVQIRVGGKERKVSTFEASFRRLAQRAAEGHLPSIKKFLHKKNRGGQKPPLFAVHLRNPEDQRASRTTVSDWIRLL